MSEEINIEMMPCECDDGCTFCGQTGELVDPETVPEYWGFGFFGESMFGVLLKAYRNSEELEEKYPETVERLNEDN